MTQQPVHPLDVVGLGAAGWSSLAGDVQDVVGQAQVIVGSRRQLDLVPEQVTARRVLLPSPMVPGLEKLLPELRGERVCILASGDPMWHGIGATIVRLLGAERIRVHPHPSALSLACARLGWSVQDVVAVNLLAQPVETLLPQLHEGRRVVALIPGPPTVSEIADLLRRTGFGPSRLVALASLAGPAELRREGTADLPPVIHDPLAVVALDCRADGASSGRSTSPGLPDEVFEHDGQLTKRDVRASALSRLAPEPGQLLWDVGAGAGSIAVEWMRHHPSCRAVAVERVADRAARVQRNATRLGVPAMRVVQGTAPAALRGLDHPDAIFVGGGGSDPGLVEACHAALAPRGRLVVHAVTAESEAALLGYRTRFGGELTRLRVEQLEPLGSFTTWRPQLAVTQWSLVKGNR